MSAVRSKIEEILGKGTKRSLNWGYIDPRKGGYRLKLTTRVPASEEEKAEILRLPHVTKVGYTKVFNSRYLRWGSPASSGITIYFDRRLSEIKL